MRSFNLRDFKIMVEKLKLSLKSKQWDGSGGRILLGDTMRQSSHAAADHGPLCLRLDVNWNLSYNQTLISRHCFWRYIEGGFKSIPYKKDLCLQGWWRRRYIGGRYVGVWLYMDIQLTILTHLIQAAESFLRS